MEKHTWNPWNTLHGRPAGPGSYPATWKLGVHWGRGIRGMHGKIGRKMSRYTDRQLDKDGRHIDRYI